MRYCVADIDEETCDLMKLWELTCDVSLSQLFCVLVDRSLCPVEIYDSGVLVARAATYCGV